LLRFLALLQMVLLLGSCSNETGRVNRSFYYWKTSYELSSEQLELLNSLNVSTLYLRLFDVDYNSETKRTIPLGVINFKSRPSPSINYIPVVYLTNRCLLNHKETEIDSLAVLILKKVDAITENNNIRFTEFQIDCDWTEKTKSKYFTLAKIIRENLNSRGKIFSVTIRLHQVKYPDKTGVPPCDRGMLMFYNMGKIGGENKNSIYNEEDAAKYTAAIDHYPLPLDAALPIFSWSVQSRDHKTISLMNQTNPDSMSDSKLLKEDENYWLAAEGFYYNGTYLRKNDRLKFEHASPEFCLKAAYQLKEHLDKSNRNIVLFDFNEVNLSYYEKKDLEAVFNSFH
jgi:hypothetical protein